MKRMNTIEKYQARRRVALLLLCAVVLAATGSVAWKAANGEIPLLTGQSLVSSKTSDGVYLNSGQLLLYVPNLEQEAAQLPAATEASPDTDGTYQVQEGGTSSAQYTVYNLLQTQNITSQEEDLSVFDNHSGVVYSKTYEAMSGTSIVDLDIAGQIRNVTDLTDDVVYTQSTLLPDFTIEKGTTEPQVLILHTHTTESYEPDGDGYFDADYTSRTLDATKSVVAVGEKIAQEIAAAGIGVIHDGTWHDYPYFPGAYDRSAETVKAILEQYPSIKVVLDIHRDAISETDGSRVAAVAEINGREAAQVMIISAADGEGYSVPNYLKNLSFASLLQRQMESDWSGLTRPVLFQYCHYNQDLSTGSLLIEVGSHGNTLEQALYSGELIGKSIAQALLSLS